MVATQLFYLVRYYGGAINPAKEATLWTPILTEALASLLAVYFFARLIEQIKNNLTRRALAYIIVIVHLNFNAYLLSTGITADYTSIVENISLAFTPAALSFLLERFLFLEQVIALVLLLTLIVIDIGFGFLSKLGSRPSWVRAISFAIAWLVLFFLPLNFKDPFVSFAKSAWANFQKVEVKFLFDEQYPFVNNKIQPSFTAKALPQKYRQSPHIFLIMIESYNANFIEQKNQDGQEYTPFFNRLLREGAYFENFFGNSVQTSRGQGSIFFSLLPPYKGKLFWHYPKLSLRGFPFHLQELGYQTIFFQAYANLNFENTYRWVEKAGFQNIHSFDQFKKSQDAPYIGEWGPEDGLFYQRFFEYLDSRTEKFGDKPILAALATIATHVPCWQTRLTEATLIKKPRNLRERYINALRLSDAQLAVFFEELKKRPQYKDSIVIVTSDHSYPMGEHGISNNEVSFYQEGFRIPLLILAGTSLQNRRFAHFVSQIDLAPTIFDMIGQRNFENSFQGQSVFLEHNRDVFLVQPYNGIYLSTIRYPYKYVKNLKTQVEHLFQLESDPSELQDQWLNADDKTKNALRDSMSFLFQNQQLIESNRVQR